MSNSNKVKGNNMISVDSSELPNAHEARALAEHVKFEKILSDAKELISLFYKELQSTIDDGQTEVNMTVVLSKETLNEVSQFLRFLHIKGFTCSETPDSVYLKLNNNNSHSMQLNLSIEF